MRDLFFAMYGTGLEWTIWCLLFLLIGIVLLIVSFVKLKKKAKIAGIIISALLIWQIVPVGFYWKALFSRTDMSPSELIAAYNEQGKYVYNNNYFGYIKYMKLAANTSLIPWQKGAYYCEVAKEFMESKNGLKAVEYYNKAFKYIKDYKYYICWKFAGLTYYLSGDINTAIKITEALGLHYTSSIYYTAIENYPKALEYMNYYIEFNPNSSYAYARRAYINNKLGYHDYELGDYKRAVSMAKNEKEKMYVLEYLKIGENELNWHQQAAKNMGFVKD